jgi:hypothetical protein
MISLKRYLDAVDDEPPELNKGGANIFPQEQPRGWRC